MGRRTRDAAGLARATELLDVRRATAGDAEVVSRLNRHVQQLHAESLPWLFKPPGDGIDPRVFAEQIARTDTHVFIGYAAGEPAGYVAAQMVHRPEHPFCHAVDFVLVDQLAVAPERRRMGLGARLLREVVALAEEQGIRRVELSVYAFNREARSFFASQGFRPFGERMTLEKMDEWILA